jgi:hypothetical protein
VRRQAVAVANPLAGRPAHAEPSPTPLRLTHKPSDAYGFVLDERKKSKRLVPAAGFDFDIYARRQAELIQCFNCFRGGLHNVDHTLVRADLVLLPSLLVDMRARKHRVSLDARGQRNGAVNFGIGSLSGIDDFRRALIQHRMVVGLHPDSNHFVRMPSHPELPPKKTSASAKTIEGNVL